MNTAELRAAHSGLWEPQASDYRVGAVITRDPALPRSMEVCDSGL